MKTPVPAPPWKLRGQAIAMLQRAKSRDEKTSRDSFAARLLAKLPRVLALVHYSDSPVGAYDEVAIAILTARGPSVVEMPVNLEASRRGGRENWGYPKTLESLAWREEKSRVVFRREGETFRARVLALSIPFRARAFTVQKLNGRPVRVPIAIRGRARLAFCRRQWAVRAEFSMVVAPPRAINARAE